MKNISRSILYQGKNVFRDFGFIFWGLLYPIILAGFFYLAVSGITNAELEVINIGIEKENPAATILESIDVLNVVEISQDDIEKGLESEEIDGYVKDDLSLIVDRSGLNQTIIKGVLDQMKQMTALNEPLESLDFTVDYLEAKTQEANAVLVIFYSLFAMVSSYGVFAGIETVVNTQANLSEVGARINVTPVRKSTLLTAGMIVGLVINLLSNILLFVFLQFILKLELFTNLAYSSIFIILGNLFGISLGIFIGSSNKRSAGAKTMIAIMVTLFLSFLSGLMSPDIKVLIDKNLPLLSKYNPIAIVSNSLYRINLLDNTSNLTGGIIILLVYSISLMGISFLFLRRSKYDSI